MPKHKTLHAWIRRKKRKPGFTLIELLIVIIVIGILMAAATVGYVTLQSRAYYNRAQQELRIVNEALELYRQENGTYPTDVNRDLPPELDDYLVKDTSTNNWPKAPWPSSVYDYDTFTGSDSQQVVQISIRFCPASGPLSACRFPNEPWAENFQINSSVYRCIKGVCKAHPHESESYPGYCINCNEQ